MKISGKNKRRLGIVVLVVLGGWWLSRLESKSAVMVKKEPRQAAKNVYTVDYEGKFFRLKIPSSLVLVTEGAEESEKGENKVWIDEGATFQRLVVMVLPTKEVSVEELSSVKMRRINPDKYEVVNSQFAGANGLEMTGKEGGLEKVWVAIVGGKQISLALTANSNDKKIIEGWEEIAESLEMK